MGPKQPDDIENLKQVARIVQHSSPSDFIAPQSNMPGIKEPVNDVVPNEKQGDKTRGGHIIDSYYDKNSRDPNLDKSDICNSEG